MRWEPCVFRRAELAFKLLNHDSYCCSISLTPVTLRPCFSRLLPMLCVCVFPPKACVTCCSWSETVSPDSQWGVTLSQGPPTLLLVCGLMIPSIMQCHSVHSSTVSSTNATETDTKELFFFVLSPGWSLIWQRHVCQACDIVQFRRCSHVYFIYYMYFQSHGKWIATL